MTETISGNDLHPNSIDGIAEFVAQLRQQMKRQYDRGVNQDLSRQNSQDLLKRNMTSVLQAVYSESLPRLRAYSVDVSEIDTENEFSETALSLLTLYDGIVEELLQYALKKHNTSCALSNFPDEHKPSKTYITEVIEEAGKDWENFAMQVNDILAVASNHVG